MAVGAKAMGLDTHAYYSADKNRLLVTFKL